MDTSLQDLLKQTLQDLNPGGRVYIAYSGGLDSQVLLHLAAQLQPPLAGELIALHVNHGLSEHAGEWQSFCEVQCEQLDVHLQCREVALDKSTGSLEQQAREARYGWFEELLEPDDLLLMAHHRDDQAETVLLRLMRGSGVRGLAGIPYCRTLGEGQLLRPLLYHARSDLHQFAEQQGLSWIEDESNYSTAFDRNYIRHRVLPALTQRWPQAVRQLAMSASNCREDQALLDELAKSDIRKMSGAREALLLDCTPPLALSGFRSVSRARQRNVLAYVLRSLAVYPVAAEQMNEWLRQVMQATPESNPLWPLDKVTLVLYDGWMHFTEPQDSLHTVYCCEWETDRPLALSIGNYHLELVQTHAPESENTPIVAFEPGESVYVRTRRGGERVQLSGESFTRPLKKLFQEQRVAPWLRECMPIVTLDGNLVWSAMLGDFAPRLVDSEGHFYSFRLILDEQIKSDS